METLTEAAAEPRTVSPEHVNELKLVIREIIRLELKHIFSRENLLAGENGSTEHTILMALSSISKVHEENAMGNAVDAALGKSLDIYRQVNKLEEELMISIAKKIVEGALSNAAQSVKNTRFL